MEIEKEREAGRKRQCGIDMRDRETKVDRHKEGRQRDGERGES